MENDSSIAEQIIDGELSANLVAQGNPCSYEVPENKQGWYYVKSLDEGDASITASFVQIGEAETRPWNGYYWPIASSGFHLHDEVATNTAVLNAAYVPLQKYDLIYGINEREAEEDAVDALMDEYGDDGANGHCLGWSIASIILPEPEGVMNNGIVFSADEMKGLYSEMLNTTNTPDGFFVPRIINVPPGPATNSIGDEVDEYIDNIHILLQSYLKLSGKPLISNLRDMHGDDPDAIWHHAIYKYVSTFVEAQGEDEDVVKLTTHLYSNDDLQIPCSSTNRLDEYVYILEYDNGVIKDSSDKQNWISTSGYALEYLYDLRASYATWQSEHCGITKENVDALYNSEE